MVPVEGCPGAAGETTVPNAMKEYYAWLRVVLKMGR